MREGHEVRKESDDVDWEYVEGEEEEMEDEIEDDESDSK